MQQIRRRQQLTPAIERRQRIVEFRHPRLRIAEDRRHASPEKTLAARLAGQNASP